MTLTDYQSIRQPQINEAVEGSMTKLEKKLCRSFFRVEITSKRGNIVPVLLSAGMKTKIDKLVEMRHFVISDSNTFLFPRVHYGSRSHLSGCECLRKFATECGAKEPEKLRSTTLRKHIATMSQILNLQENELDILAKFMGHDIRVHREYYRLPEETMQVAKVSKLLLRMEKGGHGLSAGQTLDSIELEEDELAEGTCTFLFVSYQYSGNDDTHP